MNNLTFNQCPKFNQCNAPVCPLDAEWYKRVNQSDDATCFYLLESVKHGAKTHFEQSGQGVMLKVICEVRHEMIATHQRIKIALENASRTGSRMTRVFGVKP